MEREPTRDPTHLTDGNIYVADRNNNTLRKVTTKGEVTTLPVPQPGANPIMQPEYIAVSKRVSST